jgi:GT2 family glycosyltransferase
VSSEVTINIIVVNWNDSETIKKCLPSIMASDYPSYRVIVVDNGSNAEELIALTILEEKFKGTCVYFAHNAENLGYCGGNNAGLQYIVDSGFDGDVMILNPDVEMEHNTLSVMAAAMVEGVGIVTPRVVHPSGKVLFDGIRLKGYRQEFVIGHSGMPVSTDFAQGTCMLIRRSLIDRIGLFDERFFFYWEEVDLSIRAKRAGFKLAVANQTKITKADNPIEKVPTCFYYSVRNARLIRRKHLSSFTRAGYILYVAKLAALSAKLIHRPRLCMRALASVLDGFRDGQAERYGKRGTA